MTNTTLPARPGKSPQTEKSKINTPKQVSSEQAQTVLGKRKPSNKDGERRKTQKKATTTDAAHGCSHHVVPATPGTIVTISATLDPGKLDADDVAQPESDGGAPLTTNKRNKQRENGQQGSGERQADGDNQKQPSHETGQKQKQKQTQKQAGPPPSMLPREPHEALLAELQPKYNVQVLSVISSTKMEKRIAAVMSHVRKEPQRAAAADNNSSSKASSRAQSARPGVVLLHARARDATKMISIVEIVKRRIREGFFVAEGAEAQPQDKTWYQYNRVYDVEAEASTADAKEQKLQEEGHGEDQDDDNDEEDDDFEPVPQRFQEAAGVAPKKTVTVTYMSILLSRTAVPELQRKADITTQASTDPDEIEYQEWISRQV